MRELLKNISDIQVGMTFRSRLEPARNGNLAVIQLKDIRDGGRIDSADIVKILSPAPKASQLVQAGDIAFRSRGSNHAAAIFEHDIGNAVLASPMIRLRVTNKNILPEYICWYVNQPSSQSFLTSRAKGTLVKMISKQAVEQLEIEIPPLDVQQKIVGLHRLSQKEQTLLERLQIKKAELVQGILMQVASGSRHLAGGTSLVGAATPSKDMFNGQKL